MKTKSMTIEQIYATGPDGRRQWMLHRIREFMSEPEF